MTLEEIIKAYVECECPMGTSSDQCPRHVALQQVVERKGLLDKAHTVINQIADHVDRMREGEISYSIVDRVKECRSERDALRVKLAAIKKCLVAWRAAGSVGMNSWKPQRSPSVPVPPAVLTATGTTYSVTTEKN